MECICWLNI